MIWRHYFSLFLLGFVVTALVAALQPSPGYMDADYYYAGGMQLAMGRGFTEPYLWNYLDDPSGLPHPSHAYWMPLASLLAAAGAALTGTFSWATARLGFLIVAALIPPLTAALGWSLTSRRDLAFLSGLLAAFSCFYLPFLPVTDTFGLYMLFGGMFFFVLAEGRWSPVRPLLLGLLAGLMHLTRADGLLWLAVALAAIVLLEPSPRPFLPLAGRLFLCLGMYLLVMAPWFARNVLAFGVPLAPGGSRMFWLRYYDQLYAYPASQLTFAAWWQSGLLAILKARLWALGLNLANTLSVQGTVFLLPLILMAVWHLRRERWVQLAVLSWGALLALMTLVFPFAGARGGFFHAGAALQPVWWALAPVGLERFLQWGERRRGWALFQARPLFRATIIILSILLSAVLIATRLAGWGQENLAYRQIHDFLAAEGLSGQAVVVAANPPGFYLASGNPAIAVPDGDVDTLLEVARRYRASYLVLEDGAVPAGLLPLYEDPQGQADLFYLGEVGYARLFRFP